MSYLSVTAPAYCLRMHQSWLQVALSGAGGFLCVCSSAFWLTIFYSCSFIFIDGWTLFKKELCLLLFHCFVFQCLQSSGTCESQTPAVQSSAARQSPFYPPWVTYAPRHHTPREPLADTTSHLQARDCWFAKIPQEKAISEYVLIF